MNDVQRSLRDRYSHLHPLLFERCLERSKTDGELFDMLEDVSNADFPLIWNDEERKWNTSDLLQEQNPLKNQG